MLGLDAYHGNVLSEATEDDLDLTGIGSMLAMTRNDEANALACKHMEDEFGSQSVYQLPPTRGSAAWMRRAISNLHVSSLAQRRPMSISVPYGDRCHGEEYAHYRTISATRFRRTISGRLH